MHVHHTRALTHTVLRAAAHAAMHHARTRESRRVRTHVDWRLSALPIAPTHTAPGLVLQVEYYFSEGNFAKDKFMQAETAKTKEQWVNISVMATFNRMKALVPSLDLAVITAALRDSTVLEVSEDGNSVRREKT